MAGRALAWHAAVMSTRAAHVAHAAVAVVSAASRSPLVRGASAGSVHGLTVWHAFDVIVGAGESGMGLQADNIVRQRSVSPGAKRGVFIGQSPVFKSNGIELRRDRGLRAVEPRLLSGAIGGVLLQALDRGVTRGERLLRVGELLSGCRQIGVQRAHVQHGGDADGKRDQARGELHGELAHAAAASSSGSALAAAGRCCDAYRSYARASFTSYRFAA